MNLTQLLQTLKADEAFMKNITHWKTIPARDAVFAPFPKAMSPRLVSACRSRGINELYSHQHDAIKAVLNGEDIVVVTPTASGKTLCYNLPVLNAILEDDASRALYIFPTKALSSDQVSELYEFIEEAEIDIKTFTYDGDTPVAARKAVRSAGHIVITNPDMLHSAILPHHTKWVKLFENLKYVVIDEIHTYRGVFGSHLANVIRRLKRICAFYGVKPQFICCSATIANPAGLTSRLIAQDVKLIDNNGAPAGPKHFLFYNPPLVNRQLGIRRSALLEVRRISTRLIANDISTIIFVKSRIYVEVLLSYLKQSIKGIFGNSKAIRGYRGGYLPSQRKEIERGLRSGAVRGVVSTNALELGIDIGSLQACVLCGYPGTIASTWQEAGRAGRRGDLSLTILVANSSPLSQFIIKHPEYFFEKSPESGLVNPDNLYVLMNHFKCAAYELPFEDGEKFCEDGTQEILSYLEDEKLLHHSGTLWHWSAEEFPAADVSLRSASNENFVIIDISNPLDKRRVIGQIDRFAAPMLIHEEAIYIHDGKQYQVEKLDFENKKAYVRSVDVDYFTDANLSVNLRVLDVFETDNTSPKRSHGEVLVSSLVHMFKKMKFDTHENIGSGNVNLPELEMHTTACWLVLKDEITGNMKKDDVESALLGIANLLSNVAPFFLMCDTRDISVVPQVRAPFTTLPTIYIYDNCPGGIGLSEKLYEILPVVLLKCLEELLSCECLSGCPACVGPDSSDKLSTRKLLRKITNDI